MAKQLKDVVEVERVVKEKQTVYKMELTPAEVWFIHWVINNGTKDNLFGLNTRNMGAPVGDAIRLQRLRSFWPQGSSGEPLGGYEPSKMF